MKVKFYLPLSLVVLILAACAPPPQLLNDELLQDTSLVTGDPCEAPCWQGITPGETTWNDAITFIEDNPQLTNLDASVETNDPENPESKAATFTTTGGQQCCQMYSQDGEVVSNVFVLLAPESTLGDVIEQYGDPTYMQGEDVTPDQTFIALLYEELPLIVYAFGEGIGTEDEPLESQLSEDNPVIGAVYLTSDDVEVVIESTDLYEWSDFGLLSDIFDGEFDRTAIPQTDE